MGLHTPSSPLVNPRSRRKWRSCWRGSSCARNGASVETLQALGGAISCRLGTGARLSSRALYVYAHLNVYSIAIAPSRCGAGIFGASAKKASAPKRAPDTPPEHILWVRAVLEGEQTALLVPDSSGIAAFV